jgi:hypothetical protein
LIEKKEYIVIEQANPEVLYVPSYNPMYAYGPLGYPYPGSGIRRTTEDITEGIVAAGMIGFGLRHCDGCLLGWRLGLGLRLGRRRRKHQHQ